ncbi:hypothetical protein M758_7G058700 [Ceratodon purpureus]|uniref:Phytocyanin domain-containing protein n=1 Tax=Ceratodon purpureus TaxID=3225 RepID=A0A8T0H6K6_CERPU|nr:hypothetical protein KC19_7G061600 [Ceratodon purpureus]KAG0610352.1 hypothetical protein M758_7G058700 [Ceratodon purpureus]
MGSRFDGSVIAPALCAAVLVGLFLGQCSCQAVPQTVQLGGAAGWTDTANANYTLFMSTVPFKAGDTLRFNNTDIKDHDVYQTESQSDYDTCNSNNITGWTINAGDFYDLVFPDPAYRVWIIDTQYCLSGQKVEFTVLNADGTAVPPDTTADPPSLNAQQPDPESPPSPPDAPLGLAGGPSPNAASSQYATLHWMLLAILIAACYFTSSHRH